MRSSVSQFLFSVAKAKIFHPWESSSLLYFDSSNQIPIRSHHHFLFLCSEPMGAAEWKRLLPRFIRAQRKTIAYATRYNFHDAPSGRSPRWMGKISAGGTRATGGRARLALNTGPTLTGWVRHYTIKKKEKREERKKKIICDWDAAAAQRKLCSHKYKMLCVLTAAAIRRSHDAWCLNLRCPPLRHHLSLAILLQSLLVCITYQASHNGHSVVGLKTISTLWPKHYFKEIIEIVSRHFAISEMWAVRVRECVLDRKDS